MKAFLPAAGVDEVLVNLHHLPDVVRNHRGARAGPPAAGRVALWTSDLFRASLVPCFSGRSRTGMSAVRRHRPGQIRLAAQHRDIGQAVPAQRHRRRQVRDDLAGVVHRPRTPPRLQRRGQPPPQAGHPERLPQQDRPGLRYQPPAVC